MNFHSMFREVQNPVILVADRLSCNKLAISLLAPMKLVPWSLQMIFGTPLRPMNLRRVARKAEVVKSDTSLDVRPSWINIRMPQYNPWYIEVFVLVHT